MKLYKKASPEPSQRQRIVRDSEKIPSTFSYHARRSDSVINTGRQIPDAIKRPAKSRTANFWLQRFGLIIFVIVAVICAVSILQLSSSPKIVVLSSSNREPFLQTTSVYQQAAAKLFADSLWNHNKITVDTSKITSSLTVQFPELVGVSITIPLLSHRPLVYVEPAEPAIIINVSNGSFVLDSDGKALLTASQIPNIASLQLPQVTEQSAYQVRLGHQALTTNDVSFIQTIIIELAARQIHISGFTMPVGSSELDASITGQSYFVKFNLQSNDARQQAGTFLALRGLLQSQNVTPAHYIDVRVDGRAYYQ
jgi:hypothetical protein